MADNQTNEDREQNRRTDFAHQNVARVAPNSDMGARSRR